MTTNFLAKMSLWSWSPHPAMNDPSMIHEILEATKLLVDFYFDVDFDFSHYELVEEVLREKYPHLSDDERRLAIGLVNTLIEIEAIDLPQEPFEEEVIWDNFYMLEVTEKNGEVRLPAVSVPVMATSAKTASEKGRVKLDKMYSKFKVKVNKARVKLRVE